MRQDLPDEQSAHRQRLLYAFFVVLMPRYCTSISTGIVFSVLQSLPPPVVCFTTRVLQFWNTVNGSMLNSVDTGSQVNAAKHALLLWRSSYLLID